MHMVDKYSLLTNPTLCVTAMFQKQPKQKTIQNEVIRSKVKQRRQLEPPVCLIT